MDAAEKARVIEELRVIKSGWPPHRARDEAHVALLNLGDPVAISETMRLYKGRYGDRRRMSSLLRKTNQLLLIPLLAEDWRLRKRYKQKFTGKSLWIGPRPVISRRLICEILANALDVSPAVKRWAKDTGDYRCEILGLSTKQAAERLSEVRKFWAKNQALFAAKNYSALSVPD